MKPQRMWADADWDGNIHAVFVTRREAITHSLLAERIIPVLVTPIVRKKKGKRRGK